MADRMTKRESEGWEKKRGEEGKAANKRKASGGTSDW